MEIDDIKEESLRIASEIARQDYAAVMLRLQKSRLSEADIRLAIEGYGKRFVPLPDRAIEHVDVIRVLGAEIPTWSVRVPLWSEEEGRSDLTLELTMASSPSGLRVELDDLHVL